MSFPFRLQPLMHLREQARDERRALLADALRVDAELERRETDVRAELRAVRGSQHVAVGPIDIDRMLESQRFELLLEAQLADLAQQRTHVAREIETRRQALVEADRELRVLEKLREKQYQRWLIERQRREQRLLDEAAALGHGREHSRHALSHE